MGDTLVLVTVGALNPCHVLLPKWDPKPRGPRARRLRSPDPAPTCRRHGPSERLSVLSSEPEARRTLPEVGPSRAAAGSKAVQLL